MPQKNENRIIPLTLKKTKFPLVFFLPSFLPFHTKILFYELKFSEAKSTLKMAKKNILSMYNCVHTHTCTFSDKQI